MLLCFALLILLTLFSTPACRAVSFAALDTLLFYDLYHKWLTQMATKGYLRFFVDQITTPLPAELQARATAMMVNESVLSLFKRIASSERGMPSPVPTADFAMQVLGS